MLLQSIMLDLDPSCCQDLKTRLKRRELVAGLVFLQTTNTQFTKSEKAQ
jgi:hypothetical protein